MGLAVAFCVCNQYGIASTGGRLKRLGTLIPIILRDSSIDGMQHHEVDIVPNEGLLTVTLKAA